MWQEDIEALQKFLFALDWLLACRARYSNHFQFGLAHIDYHNLSRIGERYGARGGSIALDKVAHSLRSVFRKTDLVARQAGDFWILTPHVPAIEKVSEKVRYIVETWPEDGLQIVERDISFFVLGDEAAQWAEGRNPLEFLAYLKENHMHLARYETALQASE